MSAQRKGRPEGRRTSGQGRGFGAGDLIAALERKAALEDEYKKTEELCSKVEEEATHIRGEMLSSQSR